MIDLFWAVWQVLQNTLGYIMSRIWRKHLEPISDEVLSEIEECEEKYDLRIYFVTGKSHRQSSRLRGISGFSLGRYVCLDDWSGADTVLHETGHAIQSRLLGPLYLIVVGISSAVFCNLWDRTFHKKWDYERRVQWYYSRFPENWADRLGGVKRPWDTKESAIVPQT